VFRTGQSPQLRKKKKKPKKEIKTFRTLKMGPLKGRDKKAITHYWRRYLQEGQIAPARTWESDLATNPLGHESEIVLKRASAFGGKSKIELYHRELWKYLRNSRIIRRKGRSGGKSDSHYKGNIHVVLREKLARSAG